MTTRWRVTGDVVNWRRIAIVFDLRCEPDLSTVAGTLDFVNAMQSTAQLGLSIFTHYPPDARGLANCLRIERSDDDGTTFREIWHHPTYHHATDNPDAYNARHGPPDERSSGA